MDEQSSRVFRTLIITSQIEVEKGYMQLAKFNNVVLAAKRIPTSSSGFSFLVAEYNSENDIFYRSYNDEFQNASTLYVLRSGLVANEQNSCLEDDCELEGWC